MHKRVLAIALCLLIVSTFAVTGAVSYYHKFPFTIAYLHHNPLVF